MKRVPTESCHTPAGPLREAETAIPPSPEDPSPATVSTRYGGIADTIHPQAERDKKKRTTVELDIVKSMREKIICWSLTTLRKIELTIEINIEQ
jgi:hypothetical protein